MKKLLFIFFALVSWSFCCSISQAQNQEKNIAQEPIYIDLSKTFGYAEGQRLRLEKIKKEYPDLLPAAEMASANFEYAFGRAESSIANELKSLIKDSYPQYAANLQNQLAATLNSQIETHDSATQFVSEVESRTKGDIPSPFLETLLTYQYKNNPSEEFARNFIRSYSTLNHPKAQGLDITISYPVSWKPEEGDRPHIVQKFISENGRGLENFLIMVQNLPMPAGYVISEKELSEFFTEAALKEMVPQNAKFISAKPIILDNYKAGVIVYDQTMQRLDFSLTFRTQMYVTIIKDKMVFLQSMVTAEDSTDQVLQERFEKFEPLFRMVTNSFIVQNQYNDELSGKLSATNSTNEDSLNLYFQGIVASFFITWLIGLLPPIIIRFLLFKKPMKYWPAIGIAAAFWFLNFIIFVGLLHSENKSHLAILLIAYVSYYILRYGHKKTSSKPQ